MNKKRDVIYRELAGINIDLEALYSIKLFLQDLGYTKTADHLHWTTKNIECLIRKYCELKYPDDDEEDTGETMEFPYSEKEEKERKEIIEKLRKEGYPVRDDGDFQYKRGRVDK